MYEFATRSDDYEQIAQNFADHFQERRNDLAANGVYESNIFDGLRVTPEQFQHALLTTGRAIGMTPKPLRDLSEAMPSTQMHQEETAVLAALLVHRMGLGQHYEDLAALIGVNHDDKKADPEISQLVKLPRKLTDDEYRQVATHAVKGAYFADENNMSPEVVVGIALHHENIFTVDEPTGMGQLQVTERLMQMVGEVLDGDQDGSIRLTYIAVILADVYSAMSGTGEDRSYKVMIYGNDEKIKDITARHYVPSFAADALRSLVGNVRAA